MSKKVVIPTKPVRDPAKLDQWISGEGGQAAAPASQPPPPAVPPPASAAVIAVVPPPVMEPEPPAQPVEPPAPVIPMKRLTLDISESLHRRLKATCAQRGTKMVDDIRLILEREFPE
jgi:hypothetical protein